MAQKIKNTLLEEKRGNRTQREVAKDIGISEAYYSLIENGKRIPPYKIMKKISDYYKGKPDYFFYKYI